MHVEHSLKELFSIILPEEVLLNVTLEHKINVINAHFSLNWDFNIIWKLHK